MSNDPKNLAIAYGMKKKNKKYAKGGMINESAASEQRPMPSEKDKDAAMVSRNDSQKPLKDASWTSDVTVKQAQKPSLAKLKHPSMVPSNAFSVRLRDQEDDLQASAKPASPMEQPSKADDEMDADRKGPSTPSLAMKMMAEGGIAEEMDMQPEPEAEDERYDSISAAIMAKRQKMALGGQVDIDENNDEMPNDYYDANEAALKENYDEDFEDVSQPMDSNEMGDPREDEESDPRDRVSAIRRKMAVKRAFR